MAMCWPCAVPIGSAPRHCRKCDCCRPLVRPDLQGNKGVATRLPGYALSLLAVVVLIAASFYAIWR